MMCLTNLSKTHNIVGDSYFGEGHEIYFKIRYAASIMGKEMFDDLSMRVVRKQ